VSFTDTPQAGHCGRVSKRKNERLLLLDKVTHTARREFRMIAVQNDGTVSFRVFLPHAARVELLGDFTAWREQRVQMKRENPGWWSATVPVGCGEHLFCYLVDGSIWLADYAAHGVRLNDYGGWVSQLRITAVTVEPKPAQAGEASAELQHPGIRHSVAVAAA